MRIDLATARLIAQMMHPERPVAGLVAPAPEAYQGLVQACQADKTPLLSLSSPAPVLTDFYASPVFQDALIRERAAWNEVRAGYMAVRQTFEREGIRDVMIKSTGLPPAVMYRSDNLDILVALEHGRRARQILRDLGYAEVKNVEEPHKFLFRKFHCGVSISAIHLHESVGWGTGFMDDVQVLARARPAPDDPQVLIPSAEDGLLITLAHAFYEDKAVKLGDVWKVTYALSQRALDWDAMVRQAERRGWREGLDTCIWLWAEIERTLYDRTSFPAEVVACAQRRAPGYSRRYLQRLGGEELSFPVKVSFRFSKQHYYRKVYHDRALRPSQKALDALRHSLAGIKRRLPFRSQRPLLITLSGVDGSGKTAHAETLTQALRECELSAHIVWSRGGSSALTDLVISLVKPFIKPHADLDVVSSTRQAKVSRKSAWLSRPLLRAGWTHLVALDLLLTYWLKIAWPLFRGRIVVSDRYLYDALVELAALTGQPEITKHWTARLLRALCPRPTLAYLLDVAPRRALERKPDETLDFLEKQADIYQHIAVAWGMQVVDSNGDFGAVTDAITHQVLRLYYQDWHTIINGLFLANPIKDE